MQELGSESNLNPASAEGPRARIGRFRRRIALARAVTALTALAFLLIPGEGTPGPEFRGFSEGDRSAAERLFDRESRDLEVVLRTTGAGDHQRFLLADLARLRSDWESTLRQAPRLRDLRQMTLLSDLAYLERDRGDTHMIGAEDGDFSPLNGPPYQVARERKARAEKALPRYEAALALFRLAGDRDGEHSALDDVGEAYGDVGEARKAAACNATARVLYLELHGPSFARRMEMAVVRPITNFFEVTTTGPIRTVVLLWLFGVLSIVAARRAGVPAGQWIACGSGWGIAVFLALASGANHLTDELGRPSYVSSLPETWVLVTALSGIAAWVVVRTLAGAPAGQGPGWRQRLSSLARWGGATGFAAILLVDALLVGAVLAEPPPVCIYYGPPSPISMLF
jgi:hypothetical protein